MHHQHHGHRPKPDEKFAKLRSLVERCSYPSDVCEFIISSCEHVLGYFTEMDCDILSFEENFVQKSFIELKGKVPINYKGSNYSVLMSMMIPQNFPMQPPNVRIINDNPMVNEVDHTYASSQSQTDPNSYLLRNLQTCKNWQAFDSNLFIVVEQVTEHLSKRFPFKKRKQGAGSQPFQSHVNNSNQSPFYTANSASWNTNVNQDAYNKNLYPGSNAGFIPQNNFSYVPPGGNNSSNMCKPTGAPGFPQGNTPLPYYHVPQPSNFANLSQGNSSGIGFNANQGGFSANQGGFNVGNPGFNNPIHQTQNFYPGSNQANNGFGAQSMKMSSSTSGHSTNPAMGANSVKTQAINHQTPQNLEKINKAKQQIAEYKKYTDPIVKEIMKEAETLRTQRLQYYDKSQNLDIISRVLIDETADLKLATNQMHEFLKLNEHVDDFDWKKLVKPEDQVSNQLTDLISSSKSWDECCDKFEKDFVHDQISLQDFLKVMRKIEEQKFICKMLLKKCIKHAIQN